MLQGRLFSYNDTHRHRLGANFLQIPVNCPYRAKPRHYQRDGPMTVNNNHLGDPNYFPNSFSGPQHDQKYVEHIYHVSGDVKRWNSHDDDNFSQVSMFYNRVLDSEARGRLCDNIASHLCNAQLFIQNRAIENFRKVDEEFGENIKHLIEKYYKFKNVDEKLSNL